MRLPTWEELESVEEQLDVLEHPLDKPLFVAGPPGSGKTVLAVRRAQMIGEVEPDVVVLTFNRMLRRLMGQLGEQSEDAQPPDGAIFRTMQSYIWNDYRDRARARPPTLPDDPYAYAWPDMLYALKQSQVQPNRPHLVVDEGQDLPEGFFRYASSYISRTLSVFADDDQALTKQRTTLEQIKSAADLPDPILLTQNHRNTPEVARLAEHFHTGRLPAAEVRRSLLGQTPRLVEDPSLPSIVRLVSNWQSNQGGSTGVIVDRNRTGERFCAQLRDAQPSMRVDFYSNKNANENQIHVLQDGVTVLNKESVKGQEFDTVFLLELNRFLPCGSDSERRGMYMMCSRARDDLWLVCGPDGRLTQAVNDALPGPDVLERP